MPQTGAAGFRRSDRHGDSLPAPIVGFDPVREITAYDNRASARPRDAGMQPDADARGAEASGSRRQASGSRPAPGDGRGRATGSRRVTGDGRDRATDGRDGTTGSRRVGEESRAATRAAMAEAFAAQFGVDEASPSAESLADRFGFRFEDTAGGPAGRRTITITGHGAERSVPPAERSVGRGGGVARRRGGRPEPVAGLYADRVALWAVGLAIVLALVAAMSAHAIPLH